MEKPRIRIYPRGVNNFYQCNELDKKYGSPVSHIQAIWWVLKVIFYLQKNDNYTYKSQGQLNQQLKEWKVKKN